VLFGQILDLREIHHHAVRGVTGFVDHAAGEGDFNGVAVPVQVTALAFVIRDAVPGIEFQTAGDKHGRCSSTRRLRIIQCAMLTTDDHRRDSAGLLYVYPVVSRRAGGVSIGINLNPNNACNWACLYCQVDNLTRGGPPPIDLDRLESELEFFLRDALEGDFMQRAVPPEARRLMDVAFSGNGEPTSAAEFADAVARVGVVLARFGQQGRLLVRLITNGSLMHRPEVQRGVRHLAELGGEVWFKVDRALPEEVAESQRRANSTGEGRAGISRSAPDWRRPGSRPAGLRWMVLAPSHQSQMAYCDFAVQPLAGQLAGMHLYGLARPSMQPAAPRLSALVRQKI
jgi:hypothetical protein